MRRLTWLVGPPAAGKSTWAEGLLRQPHPPRVLELARWLEPLMDPGRPRRGMMEAKGLLIRALRRVELDPANDGLPPLLVIAALVEAEHLLPLAPEEELLLLLPERTRWERQFLARPPGPAPGSRPMSLEEARGWYERYEGWARRGLPLTRVLEPGAAP